MNVLTKTISIALLGLAPFICLHQANGQTAPKPSATTIKPTTVSCTVSADEKRIITANDDKSWTVTNPQTLKGHAGDYVSVTAQFDAARRRVTVKSVKVIEANTVNRPKTLNKKDNYTSA
jgi:hypothetical protein